MAWLSGFGKRIKLTVDHTDVDSGLTHFPVLVTLSTGHGIFSELGSDANRFKIAFTKADGETELYADIENFDYSGEKATYHVSRSGWAISSTVDTDFYLYYDNSHADNTTYISDSGGTAAQSVWDSNFKMVQHMNQDPSGTAPQMLDSTSNNNDGTSNGSMTSSDLVDGLNGKALDFDGSNDLVYLGENPSYGYNENITIEACIKTTDSTSFGTAQVVAQNSPAIIYQKWMDSCGSSSGRSNLGFQINNGKVRVTIWYVDITGTDVTLDGAITINDNSYHCVTAVLDKTNSIIRIYVDGVQDVTLSHSWTPIQSGQAIPTNIAARVKDTCAGGSFFTGLISNVKLCNTARSAAWIKATNATLKNTLLTYGSEQQPISATHSSTYNIGDISNSHEIPYSLGDVFSESQHAYGLLTSKEHESEFNIVVSSIHNSLFYIGTGGIQQEHQIVYGITVSNVHESVYDVLQLASQIHEIIYSILTTKEHETLFGIVVSEEHETLFSMGFVDLEHTAVYSLRSVQNQIHKAVYEIQLLFAEHETSYAIISGAAVTHESVYNLSYSPTSIFDVKYELLVSNPLSKIHNAPYVLILPSENVVNSISAKINGVDINVIDLDISTNDDSFCFSLECGVADIESWTLCVPDSTISIIINLVAFEFVIDERSRDRSFGSNKYNISGRSKTSVLAKGKAAPVYKTWETVNTYDVVEELCNTYGISFDYQILSWSLPSGVLVSDGEYPIEIIKKITEACGAIIQTTPSGILVIKYKYPVSPVKYDLETPALIISDAEDIFSISESKDIRSKYNAVYVMDSQTVADYTYSIQQLSHTGNTITLAVCVYPFVSSIDLKTSYLETGLYVDDNGIIEETKTEQVEVIKGECQSQSPVYSIDSYSYLNSVDLGSINFSNKKITTTILEQSILEITYKTRYHKFTITNSQPDKIQVYTEEVA